MYPDGAAGKDGRIQPGDRVVDVNKEIFKTMEQDKGYQTVLKVVNGPVSLSFIIVLINNISHKIESFYNFTLNVLKRYHLAFEIVQSSKTIESGWA